MTLTIAQLESLARAYDSGEGIEWSRGHADVHAGNATRSTTEWIVLAIRSCAERDLITARATPEHKDAP